MNKETAFRMPTRWRINIQRTKYPINQCSEDQTYGRVRPSSLGPTMPRTFEGYRFADTGDNDGQFFLISPVPEVTSEAPSTSPLAGPTPSLENSKQSGKRKAETNSREGVFFTPIPHPVERINIGFRQDELDPTVLEKLPALATIATASVHKYWTPTFSKAADNAELMELLKLAEMYTSLSHVLNCELYKVLAMKVDELRSTDGGIRMLTRCVQKTNIFENGSHFLKTRGLVPYMTLPKLRQSRRRVYVLRRKLNRN
ncbi:hypothetical protein Fot_28136 [Forsythia ovata]|uniref:Uncharacterized protein n=1 Tax=Forsythia ovata TaxID=205694 RepID=A0ABD1TN62_9LAMI